MNGKRMNGKRMIEVSGWDKRNWNRSRNVFELMILIVTGMILSVSNCVIPWLGHWSLLLYLLMGGLGIWFTYCGRVMIGIDDKPNWLRVLRMIVLSIMLNYSMMLCISLGFDCEIAINLYGMILGIDCGLLALIYIPKYIDKEHVTTSILLVVVLFLWNCILPLMIKGWWWLYLFVGGMGVFFICCGSAIDLKDVAEHISVVIRCVFIGVDCIVMACLSFYFGCYGLLAIYGIGFGIDCFLLVLIIQYERERIDRNMFITYMVMGIVLTVWNCIPFLRNYYPLVVVGIIVISVVSAVLIWIISNCCGKLEIKEGIVMSIVVFLIDSDVMYYLYSIYGNEVAFLYAWGIGVSFVMMLIALLVLCCSQSFDCCNY